MKILVLGGNGMLGSMVKKILFENNLDDITVTTRTGHLNSLNFDAEQGNIGSIIDHVKPNFVVNCIGIIKPRIDESKIESIYRAININALFPYDLAYHSKLIDAKVIQIATDCVYSGSKGRYDENSKHDAIDIYGKSKSLGEVQSSHYMNLRCSIVGPEFGVGKSLLNWFLSQERNYTVNGFTNHYWNGITTLGFAKVISGIVANNLFKSGTYHLIPQDVVTKYDLLSLFSKAFNRNDIRISPVESDKKIDRSLNTNFKDLNKLFWQSAGYDFVPKVSDLINEMKYLNN